MPETTDSETERGKMRALRRQLARFLAVGVVGTIVHYSVLIALVELLHVSPVVGTFCGFIVAAFVNYSLNRKFTFENRPSFGAGLVKNYAVLIVGLGINVGTVALLTHWNVPYVPAQIVATVLAFIWNYIGSRFVVFQPNATDKAT